MFDDIVPLPSRVSPNRITNWRGGHIYSDWGVHVDISLGRDLDLSDMFKYKLVSRRGQEIHEYIVLTPYQFDTKTMRSSKYEDIAQHTLYPVIYKRTSPTGARAGYFIDNINHVFEHMCVRHPELRRTYGTRILSLADFVTLYAADRLGIHYTSLISSNYCYNIQPMSIGETLDNVATWVAADTVFGEEFLDVYGYFGDKENCDTRIVQHFAAKLIDQTPELLSFSYPLTLQRLQSMLGCRYGLQEWSLLPQGLTHDYPVISLNTCITDIEYTNDLSALEAAAHGSFMDISTDTVMNRQRDGHVSRQGHLRYVNRPTAVQRANNYVNEFTITSALDKLLSFVSPLPYGKHSFTAHKNFLEEILITSQDRTYYLDIVASLLSSADLVNMENIIGTTSLCKEAADVNLYLNHRRQLTRF